ncbi:MAG: exopolyphosphatase [Nocardioides sp.]|jgi:exopolyphosphatase/guanosine-5'-triphosphate,3'-diphosphate pyrophosphatase
MKPIAAIDCGTNSIKLLIGTMPQVYWLDSRMVRLGQGVDTTGELSDEALMRTFGALLEFKQALDHFQVTPDRIRFCATSATRDASNASAFTERVERLLGVTPEVLSGAEEAALVYAGATRDLGEVPEPILAVDIGGGSTELVLGEGGAPVQSVSLDVGSVRLFERHLHDDPPDTEQIVACIADADNALDGSGVDLARARTVIGTSGTIRTIAAGVLGHETYDAGLLRGANPSVSDTHDYIEALLAMTIEQRRALGYMHPGRADVVAAGALIWSRILRRTQVERFQLADADILSGIAWSMVS